DIVQDTLLQAMTTWPFNGLPDNPVGWLHRVARNKAVDLLRKEKIFNHLQPKIQYLLQSEYTLSATVQHLFEEEEIMDSQLRMMFACCHMSIPVEAQMALILKTLCGLSTAEIAKAFLKDEETIAKRIYRAKEKIRSERIKLELPAYPKIAQRLAAVLHSLYLLFNEGYNSSLPEHLIREDLCEEAMRLTYLLTKHAATNGPGTHALLALFCFQASRLGARLDDKGNIILLKHQDRSRWHQPLIQKGNYYLELATEDETSAYHLEAAIAWLHASAPDFERTNWKAIYHLYSELSRHHPSDIVSLNKAIAAAYALDRKSAINELREIKSLDNYYLYHTAIGEIYFDEGLNEQARQCFQKALDLTNSPAEQQLLRNKITACKNTSAG
ncbi:MAG TPA: sigma-70 family RNA polymerase sigma factor, partial [Chryseolinea sp.]|nr:sigma-70 family RNA polymerase sigma factor [Chryseolinea sp.]